MKKMNENEILELEIPERFKILLSNQFLCFNEGEDNEIEPSELPPYYSNLFSQVLDGVNETNLILNVKKGEMKRIARYLSLRIQIHEFKLFECMVKLIGYIKDNMEYYSALINKLRESMKFHKYTRSILTQSFANSSNEKLRNLSIILLVRISDLIGMNWMMNNSEENRLILFLRCVTDETRLFMDELTVLYDDLIKDRNESASKDEENAIDLNDTIKKEKTKMVIIAVKFIELTLKYLCDAIGDNDDLIDSIHFNISLLNPNKILEIQQILLDTMQLLIAFLLKFKRFVCNFNESEIEVDSESIEIYLWNLCKAIGKPVSIWLVEDELSFRDESLELLPLLISLNLREN